MPRTITKPRRNTRLPTFAGDVLTLSEAAAYLRLSDADVLRLVREQGLPGRQVGDEWRFLQAALQAWLSQAAGSGKAALLASAGLFRDDPFLDEIVREAYRQRGRPITADEG